MNDIQQGFIRPRMRLIKSPWDKLVNLEFQDVAGAILSSRCLQVVTSAPESLKSGGDGGYTFKAIRCSTISPSVASLCKSYEDTLLCMQPKVPRGLNTQCNGQNPPTYGSVKMVDRINRGGSGGSSSNPSANVPEKASLLVRSTGLTQSENHLSSSTFVSTNSSTLISPVTNLAPRYRRVEFTSCRPKVPKNGNRSQGLEVVTRNMGRGDRKEQWRRLDAQWIKSVPAEGHGRGSGDMKYKKDVVPNMNAYVPSEINRCPLRLPSSFLFEVPDNPKPNVVVAQTSKVRTLIGFFKHNHSR